MKTINSLILATPGFLSLTFIAIALVGYATEFMNDNVTFLLLGL
jgi:hypothetical protein